MKKQIILIMHLIFICQNVVAQNWQSLGNGLSANPPFKPYVFDIEEFKGDIYATGYFNYADTVLSNYIAYWNGSTWKNVNGGLNNSGFSLASYNGLLFIGGMFTKADGIDANGLATWDGSALKATNYPAQNGNANRVLDLLVYKNQLIVASGKGGYILKNQQWSTLTNASIITLGIYNNELFLAGSDTFLKWDGVNLVSLPSPNSYLRSLVTFKNKLYIGGDISLLGNDTVAHLTAYDGMEFKGIANTGEDELEAMEVYQNQLFIGGSFKQFNGNINSGLISWNGKEFFSHGFFGSGYRAIHCLKNINEQLFVGGHFYISEGAPGNCIAVLDLPALPSALISGKVFHDQDMNCYFNDTIERPWADVIIKATPGPFYGITDFYGNYQISLLDGNYQLKALPIKYYKTKCPVNEIHDITGIQSGDRIMDVNFGLGLNDTCADLKIKGSTYRFELCQNNSYIFRVENRGGGLAANTVVEITFPTEFLVSDSETMYHTVRSSYNVANNVESKGNNTFQIKLGDIEPGYWRIYIMPFKIPCDWNLHDKFFSIKSKIHADVAECDNNNNENTEYDNTGMPIDPNDLTIKSEWPEAGFLEEKNVESGFSPEYRIRFQNVGTAAAIRVIIQDTIPTNLQIETIRDFLYSHVPTRMEVIENNVIKWTFDSIMLPDSTTDYFGSQGFIRFKIDPISQILPEDSIINQAEIYFDNYPPLATNKTKVYFKKPKENKIVCYPNPTNGRINVSFGSIQSNCKLVLYNYMGGKISEYTHVNCLKITEDLDVSTGFYLLEIIGDNMKSQVFKIVRN